MNDMALAKKKKKKKNLMYIEGHFIQIGSPYTNQGSMIPNECLNGGQMSKYTSSHVIR
jgi:hypothetical protein